MKKHITPLIVAITALLADVFTKELALDRLGLFRRIDFLGGFLRFDLTFNEGGVFGIMQGHKIFFLVVSIIVLALMTGYYFYEKNMNLMFRIAMALIIGGAIGNIIDRLIPGRPGVVDFISVGVDGFYRWPTFNIADSVIVAGAFMIIIAVYVEEKRHKALKAGSQDQ